MIKILRILITILGVSFIFLVYLSVRTIFTSPIAASAVAAPMEEKQYHYAFFIPASDYVFFRNLRNGAKEAAEAMNCAVSFHSIGTDPVSFQMAPYYGVDGIAVYLYSREQTIIDNLISISEAGIPVVLVENEVSVPIPTFFIGTNSFDSGKRIGELALLSEIPRLRMALVYSEKSPGLISDRDLVETGINTTMGDRLLTLQTRTTSLNPLDAEEFTYQLIAENPPVDIIVLTDPNDTIVTVQAIIDLNLVGKVQIIGFGDDEKIREYIDKGVLLGSIVRNPYRIGFRTLMALNEISVDGYTSALVDTGIQVLTSNGAVSGEVFQSGRMRSGN